MSMRPRDRPAATTVDAKAIVAEIESARMQSYADRGVTQGAQDGQCAATAGNVGVLTQAMRDYDALTATERQVGKRSSSTCLI